MSPQPTAKASEEDNDVLLTPPPAKKDAPDVSQLKKHQVKGYHNDNDDDNR
jgi:hypothetical protein